jgi:hypothetical protein
MKPLQPEHTASLREPPGGLQSAQADFVFFQVQFQLPVRACLSSYHPDWLLL